MEVWKDIKDYEGIYQASNFGNIKSLKFNKEKILKAGVTKKGYYQVVLTIDNKRESVKVHQLVAISFLDHARCGMELMIDHKDHNRSNNHVDNLEIVNNRKNASSRKIKYSSQYVGVSWCKTKLRWRATITIDYKVKSLGYFIDEYEAHLAYQNKLKEII